MKKSLNKFRATLILGLTLGLTGYTFAAMQDPGVDPNNGSGFNHSDAGDIHNIECANSGSATGNPVTTYYWFAASENNLTSSVANGGLTQITPGVQQISGSAYNP